MKKSDKEKWLKSQTIEQFVKELADELYEKTFMGNMAVQRPKVVEIPATNEAYAMIWVIRCYGGNPKAKKYFKACRGKKIYIVGGGMKALPGWRSFSFQYKRHLV